MWMRIVGQIVLVVTFATAASAGDVATAPLRGLRIEPVTREKIAVILVTGSMRAGLGQQVTRQTLQLGKLAIPVQEKPRVEPGNYGSKVTLEIVLAQVPEAILGLGLEGVPLRWQGLSADGNVVVVVNGSVDASDRERVQVPAKQLYDMYVGIGPIDVVPVDGVTGVRALISIHNPLGFDVVAKSLDYRLFVGGTEVIAGRRPGVRLRSGKASDVLIEERLPVAELAAGVIGLLSGERTVALEGTLVLETPLGDRFIPLGPSPDR